MTALRDWVHNVSEIGDKPLVRSRAATPEECVELARELDILACSSFDVSYEIRPLGKERYKLSGSFAANVEQACIVTLEPVPAAIKETFAVELAPAEVLSGDSADLDEIEVSSLPDVEPIENGVIEVGTILFGLLSAALPPYPRVEGAEFDWVDPKIEADRETTSPFAALAKLKPEK